MKRLTRRTIKEHAERTKAAEADFSRICRENGFDIKKIRAQCRERSIVDKRRIVSKEMREIGYSYPEIGAAMHRDHTTIMNQLGVRK